MRTSTLVEITDAEAMAVLAEINDAAGQRFQEHHEEEHKENTQNVVASAAEPRGDPPLAQRRAADSGVPTFDLRRANDYQQMGEPLRVLLFASGSLAPSVRERLVAAQRALVGEVLFLHVDTAVPENEAVMQRFTVPFSNIPLMRIATRGFPLRAYRPLDPDVEAQIAPGLVGFLTFLLQALAAASSPADAALPNMVEIPTSVAEEFEVRSTRG
jgi:hypothetical protein